MRINWVFADACSLDPTVDLERLKSIGSTWGSWRTWRSCQTDNVICNDKSKATDLIRREFQKTCNFYVPESIYVDLNRPTHVRLFQGEFKEDIAGQDELIAMHLTASQSDIVLLLGFDWQPKDRDPDPLTNHLKRVYRFLVKQAIKDNPAVQWVLLDHPTDLMTELDGLDNLVIDSLANVFETLSD